MKESIFISFDVEADGPSPARNNCLQIALVACKYHSDPNPQQTEDWVIDSLDLCLLPQAGCQPDPKTMNEFWSQFPEVLQKINDNAGAASTQMQRLSDWLKELETNYVIVKWVAAPAAYDWQWLNYLYNAYKPTNPYPLPFKCECMSSVIASTLYFGCKWDDVSGYIQAGTEFLPHTHYALEDALEQGYKYLRLRKFIREHQLKE